MGGRGAKAPKQKEAWRSERPEYQEKTAGGVYFYSEPGRFATIEKRLYNRLPKYAQASVVQLDGTDVSISGWFKIDGGLLYMNHEKSNFMAEVRAVRSELRNANGFNGDVDKYVIKEIVT